MPPDGAPPYTPQNRLLRAFQTPRIIQTSQSDATHTLLLAFHAAAALILILLAIVGPTRFAFLPPGVNISYRIGALMVIVWLVVVGERLPLPRLILGVLRAMGYALGFSIAIWSVDLDFGLMNWTFGDRPRATLLTTACFIGLILPHQNVGSGASNLHSGPSLLRACIILVTSLITAILWLVAYVRGLPTVTDLSPAVFMIILTLHCIRYPYQALIQSASIWLSATALGALCYVVFFVYDAIWDDITQRHRAVMFALFMVCFILGHVIIRCSLQIELLKVSLDNSLREIARRRESTSLMAASITHDLRSPIVNAMELIREKDGLIRSGLMSDADVRAQVMENLRRSESLIKNISEYMRLEADPQRVEEIRILPLMQSIASRYSARANIVLIDIPDLALLCNQEGLERAIENLLENAITHYDGHEQVQIVVTGLDLQKKFQLSLEDNGPGIDEEDRIRILMPFRQGPGKKEGQGLGLSIASELLARSGADLSFTDPQHGTGARVVITMPKARALIAGQKSGVK